MKFNLEAFAVNWANIPCPMWPRVVPLTVDLPDDDLTDSWHTVWGFEGLIAGPSKRHTRRRALVNQDFRYHASELASEYADKQFRAKYDLQDQLTALLCGSMLGVGIVGLLVGLSEIVGRTVG